MHSPAPPDSFFITTSGVGTTTLIALHGDLDLLADPQLAEHSARLISGSAAVVLDLREVGFMDARGLECLVRLRNLCELGGRHLSVIRGPGVVQRLFTLCGLEDAFEFVAAPVAP